MRHHQSKTLLDKKIEFMYIFQIWYYFLLHFSSLKFLKLGEIMPIHLQFNNIRSSKAVTDHVNHSFKELLKITDNKYPFHVYLNKVPKETYNVAINCCYKNKPLSSKSEHQNLYKALAKGINSIKIQVIRKAEKERNWIIINFVDAFSATG